MSDITREEIEVLQTYNNDIINGHIEYPDRSLRRLLETRGEVFETAIRENRLNAFEVLLISGYADFIGPRVNHQLRARSIKRDNAFLLYEYLLNKGLDKVVSEDNSTVYVMFQSNGERDALLTWFENRVGESVQFPNFLSSSRDKWTSGYDMYLEIQTNRSSSGKYIAPLTNKLEQEQEVLFKSNSKFSIESINIDTQTIHLIELDYKVQANYLLYDLFHLNIRNKEEPLPLI